jgi:hypothetical protein
MTLIINPGSRIADQPDNTYARALAYARRWHEQMRGEGFGHDVELIEPDPTAGSDGRWMFAFRHRVTGVVVYLEAHGLDPDKHPFARVYWRGSSSAQPALEDWSASGYVQTFRTDP